MDTNITSRDEQIELLGSVIEEAKKAESELKPLYIRNESEVFQIMKDLEKRLGSALDDVEKKLKEKLPSDKTAKIMNILRKICSVSYYCKNDCNLEKYVCING